MQSFFASFFLQLANLGKTAKRKTGGSWFLLYIITKSIQERMVRTTGSAWDKLALPRNFPGGTAKQTGFSRAEAAKNRRTGRKWCGGGGNIAFS